MIHQYMHLLWLGIVLTVGLSPAVAATTNIRDVRLWTAPDHTRIVFDLNRKLHYKLLRLHNPERIVIDMKHTRMSRKKMNLNLPDPLLQAVRYGKPKKGVFRVVFDVRGKPGVRTFLLKPSKGKPHRLVVDLLKPQLKSAVHAVKTAVKKPHHEIVVAVDAGHGGEDPGAIGRNGLMEKDVTLQVAKKLAAMINKKPGMRAVLIRKGDYFVRLGQRVRLVRKYKADLMISIHADAVKQRTVTGSSVYTLAERGVTADKVAIALAAKENAADEIGGVMPHSEVSDPMVRNILGDMAKRDSLNSSQLLAESVLQQMQKISKIKYASPKRARFVVLGALEVPSVLVELDFISNPVQERKLKSRKHQQRLARALFDASRNFFQRMGMLNTAVHSKSES
ncbi:MAG: N-acetylmuramoyl-L-alanine amidase [Mariprofundaceae bacterium]